MAARICLKAPPLQAPGQDTAGSQLREALPSPQGPSLEQVAAGCIPASFLNKCEPQFLQVYNGSNINDLPSLPGGCQPNPGRHWV